MHYSPTNHTCHLSTNSVWKMGTNISHRYNTNNNSQLYRVQCVDYLSLSKFNIIKYKNMSEYHNIVLILPSAIPNDYFWTGGKFAYDTRHDDWSRGVLFSPWLVIRQRQLLLAWDYSWPVTPAFVTSSFKIFLTQTFPRCGATLYIAFEGDVSAFQWCQFCVSLNGSILNFLQLFASFSQNPKLLQWQTTLAIWHVMF